MTTGERIKKARKEYGLTQKELAEKIGTSRQNIAQWESGIRNPKIESIRKIAEALDVPVGMLSDNSKITSVKISPEERRENFLINTEHGPMTRKEYIKTRISDQLQQRLLDHFHQLNPQGQEKAVEQVELVSKVPEYRADQDHEDKEKGPATDPH